MNDLVKITDNISYIPSSTNPLSCDVIFIKADDETFIFDVGFSDLSCKYINSIQGKKNIIISHFHPDHILNLKRVSYDNLYVSKYTKKYTEDGIEVNEETVLCENPLVKIIPLPSSHAKGCLCLLCGDYCFMGDGTYCKEKLLAHSYNAQLLKEEIEVLEKIPAKYFCLDHDKNFIQKKEELIVLHKQIYSRRNAGNPEISVEDFFNPDGSVKIL